MSKKIQTPRGTHDLFGDEMRNHKNVINTALDLSKKYGFEEIQTPIFEMLEVFVRNLGETSDVVNKEMYIFEDRGGERMSLRPEGTASVSRAFVQHGMAHNTPYKCIYTGAMFRYERPQKGRQRQFHQIGTEIIGSDSPNADIEIIILAKNLLDKLGLKNISLELNSLGDSESRDEYRKALVEYLEEYKNDLSEDSKNRLTTNPLRILDSKDKTDQKIVENAPKMYDYLNEQSKEFYEIVKAGLNKAGIEFNHNNKLVRGLDYYQHTAFEFVSNDLGSQGTVIGGGRYTGIIESFGGQPTGCVGWGSGVERLAMLTTLDSSAPEIHALIPLGEKCENEAITIAYDLRNAGVNIDLAYGGNMKKRMKRADKLNAKYAIIIGDDEWENKQATVKNLSLGEQETVSLSDLANYLQKK